LKKKRKNVGIEGGCLGREKVQKRQPCNAVGATPEERTNNKKESGWGESAANRGKNKNKNAGKGFCQPPRRQLSGKRKKVKKGSM